MIDSLFTASLQGGVAVLLVWILCRALPRLPANARAWLWRLVLLKFVVTLAIGLPVRLPTAARVEPVERVAPPIAFEADDAPVAETPIPFATMAPEPASVPTRIPVLPLLWSLGALAMAARVGVGFVRSRRLLAGSARAEDALQEVLRTVRDGIPVRVSPELASPVVMGLGRPTVLVPNGFEARPRAVLEAAFAHEAAHLARRDCEWSLLAEVVRILFWFHPLAWFAVREVRAETEIAADRLAREWTETSPRNYAAALLTLVGPSAVGVRTPRVGVGTLHSTHDLTRRFQAMALDRYSRRTFTRLSAFGALPLALALAPLRVDSAPPEMPETTVAQVAGEAQVLLPIKRNRDDMMRLASQEGLNSGGNNGPRAAIEAVARLEREGTGEGTFVVKDDKRGWRIEILGMSHIEPGRSRSWRLDGTPLPKLLPFGASSGIPVEGDFDRQIVLRVSATGVRGVTGYFRDAKDRDKIGGGALSNTMPIPRRLHGDRVIVVQQGFPRQARQADFVLKYYLTPEPLTTLIARGGKVVTDPGRWDARLFSGESFASGEKGFGLAPSKNDTIVSFRKPDRLEGTLRVTARLKNGKQITAYSVGPGHKEFTFGRHPELADTDRRSNWRLGGVRKDEIAGIQLAVAKQGMMGFRDLPLHPKG